MCSEDDESYSSNNGNINCVFHAIPLARGRKPVDPLGQADFDYLMLDDFLR